MRPLARLVACVAAGLLLGGCGDALPVERAAPAAAPGCLPATAPSVAARADVGSGVVALSASGDTLWAARPGAGEVVDVAAAGARPEVRRRLHFGGAPISLATGFGALYVADRDGNRLLRVDEGSGKIVNRIEIDTPIKVVVTGRQVSVMSLDNGELTPLDPITFGAYPAIAIPALAPVDAAYQDGGLWILGGQDQSLSPYDVARAGFVRSGVRLPTRVVGAVTGGQGALWVALPTAHGVARVDAATGALGVLRASPGMRPTAVAVDDCAIWVGDRGGRVQRLDSKSGRPVGPPVRIGRSLAALVTDRGSVWASDPSDGTVVRVASTG